MGRYQCYSFKPLIEVSLLNMLICKVCKIVCMFYGGVHFDTFHLGKVVHHKDPFEILK